MIRTFARLASPTARRRSIDRRRGFTLLEMLFVLAIMVIVVGVGLPNALATIRRAKLEGPLRQAMTLMNLARFEAVKKGIQVGVEPDFSEDQLVTFRDLDEDGTYGAGDEIINILQLEGIYFWHPDDAAAEGVNTIAQTSTSIFDSTGAASTVGRFFVADDRDNHMTIEIANAATAKFVMKKWERGTSGPAVWWLEGEKDSETAPWQWY